jgi:hypothetical protein
MTAAVGVNDLKPDGKALAEAGFSGLASERSSAAFWKQSSRSPS